jgi:hypothetical protein
MRTAIKLALGVLAAQAVWSEEYTLACLWVLFICAALLEEIRNQLDAVAKKGGAT